MINTVEEEVIDLNETSSQIKARLKFEYPSLRTGNENNGYKELDDKAYEVKIAEWVANHLAKIANKKAEIAKAEAKALAEAKLAALGLTTDDLKALGL
jgi:hypothetical protein